MSAPEEIVAETPEAFKDACSRYGSFIGNFPPRYGDVSSGFKTVPVRIVYRPSAPPSKPLPSPERDFITRSLDAAVKSINDHVSREVGRAWAYTKVADGPEVDIRFAPPPPRDEAREAFEGWWKREVSGTDVPAMCWSPLGLGHYTGKALDRGYRAFLAGRASVKPTTPRS